MQQDTNNLIQSQTSLIDCISATQIVSYLFELKDEHGHFLREKLCKTVIWDFGFAIHPVMAITQDMLTCTDCPLKYVLTYKFSKDHIELLFNKIRHRGGWNNNPNVLQLKYALKPIQPAAMPQLNWSHFKPEFAGYPDEDAEAHLLRTNNWMDTHAFPESFKVQKLCLTLVGEARLWYESLRLIALDWNGLQN